MTKIKIPHYEEEVINGVLCWRNGKGYSWTPYTLEALTSALIAERSRANMLDEKCLAIRTALEKVREIYKDLL